jgi:hypothetical protein
MKSRLKLSRTALDETFSADFALTPRSGSRTRQQH